VREAIYAGSFDPWSQGHQFVLNAALDVFDRIHVLAAVNPAKPSDFDALTRERAIAHAIDPLQNWWDATSPHEINNRIIVTSTTGLVVDYAREHNIAHLIRGLRSTTDFESEFGLYFSNRAIHPAVQTWCVMCPPELIHCSSTFVRSVVGRASVDLVGTSFINQSILLKTPRAHALLLDVIAAISEHRFIGESTNLTTNHLIAAMQKVFLIVNHEFENTPPSINANLEKSIYQYLQKHRNELCRLLQEKQYPLTHINALWRTLISAMATTHELEFHNRAGREVCVAKISQTLGNANTPLFNSQDLLSME
jgi:pantetheine-phosphate adenylyltransferase